MIETLWNMRCDYQIEYFNRNRKKLLASSNIITVDKDQPLQPHLSLTLNSPYQMRLIWNSIQYEYYTNIIQVIHNIQRLLQNWVYHQIIIIKYI